ncbi:MAG TPA: MmgE/PrpD family protein, partial [Methylomirabilota bacterium]|nr:MmgE/PrpD family protein [Methylomirabilota bacterium]
MLADEIARFVVGTRFEHFPPPVVATAKAVVLDTVGCCLGGVHTDLGRTVVGLCRGAGEGDATIVGVAGTASAAEAAFANAVLSNVIDYNDTTLDPVGHLSSEVVPAALAMAEVTGASGRDLLAAVVLGYEVAIRLGRAVAYSPALMRARGPVSLPTFHVFGAT